MIDMSPGSQVSLVNRGIAEINPQPFGGEATVAVVGLTRSGTSMIASLLNEFGIFMGEKIDNAVFEDVAVADLIEKADFEALAAVAAHRNSAHSVWGFKRPNAFREISSIELLLRKPRVIVTFRDILAIAMRNNISMEMDILSNLGRYVAEYELLVRCISGVKCPMLLVSYEKFLQFPVDSIQTVAGFVGVQLTAELQERALGVVENGPEAYLKSSRLTYVGHVDRIVNGKLRGWAMYSGQPKRRARVHAFVNGQLVHTIVADRRREDLVKAGVGDGHHGFEMDVDPTWPADARLDLKVGTTGEALTNSGKELAAYAIAR